MIAYDIKRKGEVVTTVKGLGTVNRRIMGEHVVSINLNVNPYVDLRIGDTIEVYGETYTLNFLPIVPKRAETPGFNYSLEFQAPHYELGDILYKTYENDGISLTKSEFTMTETLSGFMDLLILNANKEKTGWIKGTIEENTKYVTLDFNGQSCLELLATLAASFETEWHVDHRTIHMYRKGYDIAKEPQFDTGLSFEYGMGNGLKSIERTNVDTTLYTRLYIEGSEKNLLGEYRNYSRRLQLPVSKMPYLEKNVEVYGVKEKRVVRDDIYPDRVGQVTATNGIKKFTDQFIDFDVNAVLVPDVSVKVNFLTGSLSGLTFELLKPNGFNTATKEFTLISNKDNKDLVLPNADLYPKVGDLYTLSDIYMPFTYVETGENDLAEIGQFLLDENSTPKLNFNIDFDTIYFNEKQITLNLCDSINVKADLFNLNKSIRITYLERDINNPYNYKCSVAERVKLLKALLDLQKSRKIDKAIKDATTPPRETVTTTWRVKESSFYCVQDDEVPEEVENGVLNVFRNNLANAVEITITNEAGVSNKYNVEANQSISPSLLEGVYRVALNDKQYNVERISSTVNGQTKTSIGTRVLVWEGITTPISITVG